MSAKPGRRSYRMQLVRKKKGYRREIQLMVAGFS
jgi:hypothetical protein